MTTSQTPDTQATEPQPAPPSPFHILDDYVALPRTGGLALSPDGTRLVTSVSRLSADSTAYVSAVWEVDPAGVRPARRLTRSAKGESSAAFLPDGSVLFVSGRPDPDADDEDDVPSLWLLPTGGGEARVVAKRPGGLGGVVVARESGTVLVAAETFPSSTDHESEEKIRKERKEKKVSAILHDSYPVRHWDHDLGPAFPRLFVGELAPDTGDEAAEPVINLRDLTPDAGSALVEASYDISPDGSTVITVWNVPERGGQRETLVVIDVATGARRTLADEAEVEFIAPRISPDGMQVAVVRSVRPTPLEPPQEHLVVIDIDSGAQRVVAADWDRWPTGFRWLPDGSGLIVTADHDGRSPVFHVDLVTDKVRQVTADAAAFTDVAVSPDGSTVYALRTSYLEPSAPVRLDLSRDDQQAVTLRAPHRPPTISGRLEEIETVAEDGARVRAWLALPEGASAESPAPLLLWIHGGPLGSWNAWSWRWNPWLAVARGYAVLLPDPALSTGYGREFIRRGWGAWGAAPYTDLMAITDTAVTRSDIDDTRTAAMGGSFGGYMANWVAGHTGRFRAVVTHASLWALDQFGPTTDAAWYWRREMTPEMTAQNSPHRSVSKIVTPTLVIHGDKDYRVPIGEALRLWSELAEHTQDDQGRMPHRFLYFPDENHWILTPQHAKIWYETVFAFLAHHVLGEEWATPELLA